MSLPRLYVFTISHYCEKVRWVIEHKGIDYELVTLLPGPHLRVTNKLAPSSRVPLWVEGDRVIQDSGPIIDYLEERYPNDPLSPSDAASREEVAHWEQYLATELGDRVRRYVYSHAQRDARFVRFMFSQGGPWWGRGFYALALPLILKAIKRMYGISPEVGREDLARLGELFERVDAHLGSRRYLVGDSFTRADLTFAALAAPLLHPAGHPVQWPTSQLLPAQLAEEVAPFNTTRTADYVRRMYRDHRSKVRPVR